jgi:hypothetical protein
MGEPHTTTAGTATLPWSTPSSSKSYLYVPLDKSTRSIRLFQLQLQDDGSIQGCLTNHSHDKAPPYLALSYMWGPEHPTHTISVDGQPMVIRKNLFDFLQVYRSRHLNDHVWIDQLSINQQDIPKRNEQVQFMGDIYHKAQQVIVWVHDEDSKGLHEQCLEHQSVHGAENSPCPWMSRLLGHQYWTRLWIIQEVLLARDLVIYFDSVILPWGELNACFAHSAGYNLSESLRWVMVRATSNVQRYAAGSIPGLAKPYHNLTETIAYCAASKCMDLRDRVFGLQGLLAEKDKVTIDYNMSVEQVFVMTGLCILGQGSTDVRLMHTLTNLAHAMEVKGWEEQHPISDQVLNTFISRHNIRSEWMSPQRLKRQIVIRLAIVRHRSELL